MSVLTSKMSPWTSERRLLITESILGRFFVFFCCFGEAFGLHFELLWVYFSHRFFDVVFGDVLEAFWPPFGRRFGVISSNFSLQAATRRGKRDFHENK